MQSKVFEGALASVSKVSESKVGTNGFAERKPIILTFARYYLPGYRAGGPIRTIANMADRLSDTFEFKIVTLDRDLGDEGPYPNLQGDEWLHQGKALVRYCSPDKFGWAFVARIAQETPHDVVYLNSFFDPLFTQLVLLENRLGRLSNKPIVIAPRGEFSDGGLQLKPLRKKVFIRFAKLIGLYEDVCWHASSKYEAADIERVMSVGDSQGGRVRVAPNLAKLETFHCDHTIEKRRTAFLKVCFLSRISPMKNLAYALRVLTKVRSPVRFSIYGPREDVAYWNECLALMGELPPSVEAVYEGALEPFEVVPTLSQHDLLFLPTRGENFGHVIQEALQAGLPVLISDKTPWQGLARQGVGWDLPLDDMDGFIRRIEEAAGWSDRELVGYARRSLEFGARAATDSKTVEANRRMFLDEISRRKRPISDASVLEESSEGGTKQL